MAPCWVWAHFLSNRTASCSRKSGKMIEECRPDCKLPPCNIAKGNYKACANVTLTQRIRFRKKSHGLLSFIEIHPNNFVA
jgi:hypothetical protein